MQSPCLKWADSRLPAGMRDVPLAHLQHFELLAYCCGTTCAHAHEAWHQTKRPVLGRLGIVSPSSPAVDSCRIRKSLEDAEMTESWAPASTSGHLQRAALDSQSTSQHRRNSSLSDQPLVACQSSPRRALSTRSFWLIAAAFPLICCHLRRASPPEPKVTGSSPVGCRNALLKC
jgi:hypothetical protein